jgi:hypothetical protein
VSTTITGNGVTLHFTEGEPMRRCGDCTLCCKLLPVPPLGKKAGERCQHQRHHKGCAVYRKKGFPAECAAWTCRWLVGDDTADLSRPDRSHYDLDVLPDFVTLRNNETGDAQHVEVVQIWVDPGYPDAHRDPALRAYLERRGHEGKAGIVRWDNQRAMVIFPPELSENRQWNEVESDFRLQEHTIDDVVQALSGAAAHQAEEADGNERRAGNE